MTDPLACLTTSERRVLVELMRTGLPSKAIGHSLGITRRCVEKHRHSAQQKLGVTNAFELGALALSLGLYTLNLKPVVKTPKLCNRCKARIRKSFLATVCSTCDNDSRRQKYQPKSARVRKPRPTKTLCNCGNASCSGVSCNYVRPTA